VEWAIKWKGVESDEAFLTTPGNGAYGYKVTKKAIEAIFPRPLLPAPSLFPALGHDFYCFIFLFFLIQKDQGKTNAAGRFSSHRLPLCSMFFVFRSS
jgi:hypothetical protein